MRDQFEKLKSSLVLQNPNKKASSLLLMSYYSREGTTTAAINLAESMAQDQNRNVLLVDGNTRNPCLHEAFDLENTTGFCDFPKDDFDFDQAVFRTSRRNLSVIPSGNVEYHPSQVFEHKKFEAFVGRAKQDFDSIIFDSCPIGKCYDSIVLASHLDGVLLVIEAEKTPWNDISRTKQVLEEKNIPILGAILNRRKYRVPRFIFDRFF